MSEARPAGFWIRAAALGLDVLVFVLVEASFKLVARRAWGATVDDSSVLHAMIALFTLGFAALYVILLHAGAGQTIGKMLVRVHVVMVDGGSVPLGVAVLRFFASFVSAMPLGLGYVMAGLRRDKRALHDLLAGTRVERRPARVPVRSAPAESPPEPVVAPLP